VPIQFFAIKCHISGVPPHFHAVRFASTACGTVRIILIVPCTSSHWGAYFLLAAGRRPRVRMPVILGGNLCRLITIGTGKARRKKGTIAMKQSLIVLACVCLGQLFWSITGACVLGPKIQQLRHRKTTIYVIRFLHIRPLGRALQCR